MHARTLLVFLCLGALALAQAPSPKHFSSPDGKWDAVVKWVGETPEKGDWFLEVVEPATKKSFPGPRVEDRNGRTVLWSPDSHYLAAGETVLALESGTLFIRDCPWKAAASRQNESFEASLLKEADKKRYLKHLRAAERAPRHGPLAELQPDEESAYCRILPMEWANATDLVVHCSLRVPLDDPPEKLDVLADITVRVGAPGTERILRGRYDAYEIVGKEPSRDVRDERPPVQDEEEDVEPLACTLRKAKEAPEGRIYESEEPPAPCGFQLFTFKPDGGNEHEFWVRETATGRTRRIYVYDRGFAQAFLSKKGNYIAMVDRACSNASVIAVLKRDARGEFHRVQTGSIPEKGVRLLARIFNLNPPPVIDHLYCNLAGGPDDSGKFGVVIWGYASGSQRLEHWFFDYDAASGKASVKDEAAVRAAGSPLHPLEKAP